MIDRRTKTLLKALRDPDASKRISAIRELRRIGDPSTLDGLSKVLKDENPLVRGEAIAAFGKIGGEEVVDTLIHALRSDPDTQVRRAAVGTLSKIKNEHAVTALIEGLQEQDDSIRISITLRLGQIGNTRAIPELARVLGESQNKRLVRRAAISLGSLGIEALPHLIHFANHTDSIKRTVAARGLGLINDDRAVLSLAGLLGDEDRLVRMVAAESLTYTDSTIVVPELIEALRTEDDRGVRGLIIQALGKSGDNRAIPSLLEALNSKHINVRASATGALGQIGDATTVNNLARLLNDESEFVQQHAIEALSDIDTPEALDIVTRWRNAKTNQLDEP
jgi:HEAT repeat protein